MAGEFLSRFKPENLLDPQRHYYPTDALGNPYIPLSQEVAEPILLDPDRPGKGVMVHFMTGDGKGPIDKMVTLVKKQGFLSPRQYATFSTAPMKWVHGERTSVMVYRSYSRWSREYGHYDYNSWVEGLIGVTEEQAATISPQAIDYHRRLGMRGDRGRLGWDIWSFIPPKHLLGVVDFHSSADALAFNGYNSELQKDYTSGQISEAVAVERLTELMWNLSLHGQEGDLTDPEREMFWLSYGAALTESALLYNIHVYDEDHTDQFHKADYQQLALIQPTYPWTKRVHTQALDYLNSKKGYRL